MQVRRWEGGLAVTLPDDLVQDLEIAEGDEIAIEAHGGGWRISRGDVRRAALATLETLAVDPPAGFRSSRDDAYERDDR